MNNDREAGRPRRFTGAYEGWNYGPGLAYAGLNLVMGEVRYIPGMVELPAMALPADFGRAQAKARHPHILFSAMSQAVAERSEKPTLWTFLLDLGEARALESINIDALDAVLDQLSEPIRVFLLENGRSGEPSFYLGAPLIPACVNPNGGHITVRPAAAKRSSQTTGAMPVIMAVIDDGIPFAHRHLLDAAGLSTRLDYCWIQGAATDKILPYGRDLMGAEIDASRAAYGPDDDAIYLRPGAMEVGQDRTPTINRFGSHGSHVLGAATGCGRNLADVEIDRLRIVAVQLAPAVTIDTTGFGKDAFILDALDYIVTCAEAIAEAQCGDRNAPLPLFINLSYGYTGGPHDGSSSLEREIRDRILARQAKGRPTTLVMPAGNTFGSRMHGQIPASALNSGAGFTIPWSLQPTDLTSSYLEIWLLAAEQPDDAASLSLEITAPTGAACAPSQPLLFDLAPNGTTGIELDATIALNGGLIGRCSVEMYNERWKRVLLTLAPTDPVDILLPAAPAGCWHIALQKTGGGDFVEPVACRIHRDNDPYGYSRGGRQSMFEDPHDEAFGPDGAPSRVENQPNSFIKRFGTLNGIATHDKVTVVAGFDRNTGRVTEYSSAGPLRAVTVPAGPGDVHVSAVSDDSTALRGTRAAGTRTGATFRMSGTSVAASRATLALALNVPPVTKLVPPGLSSEETFQWKIRLGQRIEE